MVDFGNGTGLPEKYRITLALSLAFLIHTLAMSVLPLEDLDTRYHPTTVQIELTPSGSQPSTDTFASRQQEQLVAEPFSVEERPTDISSLLPLKKPSLQTEQSPQEEPTQSPNPPEPSEPSSEPVAPITPPQRKQPAIPQSISRTISVAGEQTSQTDIAEAPETIEKRSTKAREEDSYVSQLAARIGDKGKRHLTKVRQYLISIGKAEKRIVVTLELKLMPNGTLVAAKIIEDSGYPEVDQEMYRAALMANPYPEPPGTASGAQKFIVELNYGKRDS